jgi:hypothetical protein
MPNEVIINPISGTPPFNLYVCDITITYCFSAGTMTSAPYSFYVSSPLDSTTPIVLKIVDANNCEKIHLLTC